MSKIKVCTNPQIQAARTIGNSSAAIIDAGENTVCRDYCLEVSAANADRGKITNSGFVGVPVLLTYVACDGAKAALNKLKCGFVSAGALLILIGDDRKLGDSLSDNGSHHSEPILDP